MLLFHSCFFTHSINQGWADLFNGRVICRKSKTPASATKANSRTIRSRVSQPVSAGVPCKRRSSVNSGAWLRRFDDVTGVEQSCVAKGINGRKAEEFPGRANSRFATHHFRQMKFCLQSSLVYILPFTYR